MSTTGSPPPPRGIVRPFLVRLGARVHSVLERTGSVAWLGLQCLRHLLLLRTDQMGVVYRQTRLQVRFTALEALPLCLLTALLLGGITLIQVFGQFSAMGAESYLSRLLARLVIRELGPLLVGVVVVGRSGTAIAAEMASMRLNGEVDALCAMGVNPIQYLLLPRILGACVSVFCLIILFDATALLGGFTVAYLRMSLSFPAFLHGLAECIGGPEFLVTFLKSLAFGSCIALYGTHFGLRVRRSTTEIPQAVTRGAVAALLGVFISGALLSYLLYA